MNAAKIVQSRTPGELSERGVKMVSNNVKRTKCSAVPALLRTVLLNLLFNLYSHLQADALGQHLSKEKFTRIFSSDLTRCHDTTLHILDQLVQPQPEIILDEILRERVSSRIE